MTQLADDDERWMTLALEEADLAATAGDVPVGAVIVLDGKLLARGRNRREVDGDPTAHAEVDALRQAARALGHWRIEGSLYVTLEPCAMCAGALVNARVKRVVYGALDPKAGAVDSRYGIGRDTALNHTFAVTSGILGPEAASRLQTFFRKLRAEGQK
jgi:tRNA(adenine34) deaminase